MKTLSAEKIFQRPGSRSGLPAWTYDNAELTSLEIEQVFLRNWLFVGCILQPVSASSLARGRRGKRPLRQVLYLPVSRLVLQPRRQPEKYSASRYPRISIAASMGSGRWTAKSGMA
jgi:hypothetical protein